MTDVARTATRPVTSPQQRYDQRLGRCLDVPELAVPSYGIRCRDNVIEVGTRQET
jgi:hypothetical protein